MSKVYANAEAFRNALEDRLRTVAQERGVQIQGLRDRAPACKAIRREGSALVAEGRLRDGTPLSAEGTNYQRHRSCQQK
jgi:hypothetical protein